MTSVVVAPLTVTPSPFTVRALLPEPGAIVTFAPAPSCTPATVGVAPSSVTVGLVARAVMTFAYMGIAAWFWGASDFTTYQEIATTADLEAGIQGALAMPGPVLTRVVVDYCKRPLRWMDATRHRFIQELTTQQKMRFLARLGTRALDLAPQND